MASPSSIWKKNHWTGRNDVKWKQRKVSSSGKHCLLIIKWLLNSWTCSYCCLHRTCILSSHWNFFCRWRDNLQVSHLTEELSTNDSLWGGRISILLFLRMWAMMCPAGSPIVMHMLAAQDVLAWLYIQNKKNNKKEMTWRSEEDVVQMMCVEFDGENGVEWDHVWIAHISKFFFKKSV